MLNLFIPSSKYQLEQFKLYTDNFKEELEDEIEKMYIVVRKQTINLPKCFGLNEKNPYEKLIDNSNKLIERAQYGKKQKELLEKHLKMYNVKYIHSIDVAYDSKRVGIDLNLFNDENIKILWTSGLLHDIGRFAQLRLTGTFKDAESFANESFGKITDHGVLGEKILLDDERIKMFYPLTRVYDKFVASVVGNHFESKVPDYPIDINNDTYKKYSISEIIKDVNNNVFSAKTTYDKLISWYVKIIQDVDRLDILKQIERGDFVPLLSNDKRDNVNPLVYDLFYNGKYISMSELRKKGIWTCNAGQLLRWSFIYQLSLVSTIRNIKSLNLIEKIWDKNPIENLKPGYDFTLKLMDALIETSPDGVYVDRAKALSKVR